MSSGKDGGKKYCCVVEGESLLDSLFDISGKVEAGWQEAILVLEGTNGIASSAKKVMRLGIEPGHMRAGGNRQCDHMEVPERSAEGRRQRGGVLQRRADQQLPAGGYRQQDDPRGQEHPLAHHLQGHLRRPLPQLLPRSCPGAPLGCLHMIALGVSLGIPLHPQPPYT